MAFSQACRTQFVWLALQRAWSVGYAACSHGSVLGLQKTKDICCQSRIKWSRSNEELKSDCAPKC
eukprot:2306824-Pleurochrysis_carterae.AAC.7